MKSFKRAFLLALALIPLVAGAARESLNQIVAIVRNEPITEMDLQEAMGLYKKRKGVTITKDRNIESQVLDLLISRTIVDSIASEESISISTQLVDNAIKREMEGRDVKTEEEFEKILKRDAGLSLGEYRNELARQLRTQQVVQLRVPVESPTPSEIEEWYKLNKTKLGKKYTFRIIQKRFNPSDTKDELLVSKLMKTLSGQAGKTDASFAKTASENSDHPSKGRGGLIGPLRLDQVAQFDPMVAGVVQNTPVNRISQVFVGNGSYYMVRVSDARDIDIDEVYEMIHSILYGQKQEGAFNRWIDSVREEESVTIFLENYERN